MSNIEKRFKRRGNMNIYELQYLQRDLMNVAGDIQLTNNEKAKYVNMLNDVTALAEKKQEPNVNNTEALNEYQREFNKRQSQIMNSYPPEFKRELQKSLNAGEFAKFNENMVKLRANQELANSVIVENIAPLLNSNTRELTNAEINKILAKKNKYFKQINQGKFNSGRFFIDSARNYRKNNFKNFENRVLETRRVKAILNKAGYKSKRELGDKRMELDAIIKSLSNGPRKNAAIKEAKEVEKVVKQIRGPQSSSALKPGTAGTILSLVLGR